MPTTSNVDGSRQLITGLSASALNADLVPSTDVSSYNWLSLYILPVGYSGVLNFLGSYDETNWVAITLYPLSSLLGNTSGTSTGANGIMVGGPVRFPYFKVTMGAYTSGTAQAILELRTEGLPGLSLISVQAGLLDGQGTIGLTNNDGTNNLAIAAGTTTDTVVVGQKGYLSHILVTATGTAEMDIYDSNTAGSGTIIAIVPASSAKGSIINCKALGVSGVTVKGDINNPGVTLFFTEVF